MKPGMCNVYSYDARYIVLHTSFDRDSGGINQSIGNSYPVPFFWKFGNFGNSVRLRIPVAVLYLFGRILL